MNNQRALENKQKTCLRTISHHALFSLVVSARAAREIGSESSTHSTHTHTHVQHVFGKRPARHPHDRSKRTHNHNQDTTLTHTHRAANGTATAGHFHHTSLESPRHLGLPESAQTRASSVSLILVAVDPSPANVFAGARSSMRTPMARACQKTRCSCTALAWQRHPLRCHWV